MGCLGGEAPQRGVWGAEPPREAKKTKYVYRVRESGVIRAGESGAIRENDTNHTGLCDTMGANSPASNSRFEVGGPQNIV